MNELTVKLLDVAAYSAESQREAKNYSSDKIIVKNMYTRQRSTNGRATMQNDCSDVDAVSEEPASGTALLCLHSSSEGKSISSAKKRCKSAARETKGSV